MMTLRSVALRISWSLVVAALLGAVASSATSNTTKTALDAQGLSRQLAASVERGDTPGVVALVVDRDGVLFEGAAGKLDVGRDIPMPSNAIFNIASMTKPVTSVAIMMLLEAGKLRLDDPVSKYLTGFDNLKVITVMTFKLSNPVRYFDTGSSRRSLPASSSIMMATEVTGL